ncbi:MAG: ArsR/SmtB family transcription factor [Steroidobacter sp.]
MSKADRALVFAALGDPIRLELLIRMRDGGSITKLADGLPMTRQAVTRHLRVLEDAKLIEARRRGREMHFVARPARLSQAKGWLDDVARQWDGTLGRFRDHVEKKSR